RHHLALTQGCRPLGSPRKVTAAHENLLLEIEGVSAYEALRSAAPERFADDRAPPRAGGVGASSRLVPREKPHRDRSGYGRDRGRGRRRGRAVDSLCA